MFSISTTSFESNLVYSGSFTQDMLDAKPVATLGVIGKLQSKFDGAFLDDPTLYRGRVGALQYVTINQTKLAFAVNKACQFM